jgi:hypothetical protein
MLGPEITEIRNAKKVTSRYFFAMRQGLLSLAGTVWRRGRKPPLPAHVPVRAL